MSYILLIITSNINKTVNLMTTLFEFFFQNKQNLQSMIISQQKLSNNCSPKEKTDEFLFIDPNSINKLSFIEYKPNGAYLFYDPKDDTKLERITVKIDEKNLEQQLSIYTWRKKTLFPIIKTKYAQIVKKQKNLLKVNIYHQVCDVKLSQLSDVPLNQAIYLLKQSVIGFQRLFNRFGTFQVTPNMICTNQKGQCKVWLNQRFQINSYIPNPATQLQLIRKIQTILSVRVHRTRTAIEFFQELHEAQNVVKLLNIIQLFVKKHKLQIPTTFSLISYSVLRKTVERFNSQQPYNSYDAFIKLSKSAKKRCFNQCKNNDERYYYSEIPNKLTLTQKLSAQKLLTKNYTISNLTTTSKLNPSEKFNSSSTMKISSNTTNTHSFKANLSNTYLSEQKVFESKIRKASLKNMTNSYEIRQGFQEEPFTRYFSAKKLQKYDSQISQNIEDNFKKITPISSKIVQDQRQQQSAKSSDEGMKTSQIYRKNGWNNKIQDIFESGPMKLSYKIGKQINPQNESHKFTILKPPGLVYSILPDEQNE